MVDAWLPLLAAGLAAGVVSTLIGVGGGIIMVPVLHYLLGVPFTEATALSLFAIMIHSPLGIWTHHRRGAVDRAVAVPVVLGGVPGVLLGTWMAPHLEVPWLKVTFALAMAAAAWNLVRKKHVGPRRRDLPLLAALIGILGGVLAKLLGIGGGLVTVPVLALLGVPIHIAVGSSMVAVFTNAAIGSLLAWPIAAGSALVLAAGALVGSPLGTLLAHRASDFGLRRIVAVALTLGAAYVAITSGRA